MEAETEKRKQRCLERLRELADPDYGEPESSHGDADAALLEFIDDDEIEAAYDAIQPKWYA